MKITILGGGLAGISLAYFLQNEDDISEIEILEKEERVGGLCRSFSLGDIIWDIGPHILFSKNSEILALICSILGNDNVTKIRRSNRILHKGSLVQYPFENDLSKLPEDDRILCVNSFLNNPYEKYEPKTMLQFFLHTFGEGITNLYLRPYNEKIWKFDPSFLDLQMVGRIPKPTRQDILNSAAGETIDGYLHQLYFYYPCRGGIESLVRSFTDCYSDKVKIRASQKIESVEKAKGGYRISTNIGYSASDLVISTIPANEFCRMYQGVPEDVQDAGHNLRYNSIVIVIVQLSQDRTGDNFAFMIADKSILFHRVSKIDFLGEAYHQPNTATFMLEITYRKDDSISQLSDEEIMNKASEGLYKLGFADDETKILSYTVKHFEYAYVLYDLDHQSKMKKIRDYFTEQGVFLHGRFGNFEYLNMDSIIDESKKLSDLIKRRFIEGAVH